MIGPVGFRSGLHYIHRSPSGANLLHNIKIGLKTVRCSDEAISQRGKRIWICLANMHNLDEA